MTRKSFFLAFSSLICMALCPGVAQAQPSGPGERIVKGRLLVKFRPSVSDGQANNMLASFRSQTVRHNSQIRVHVVTLPAGASEAAFVKAFQARPEVEFAELDRVLPPANVIPNDPWYPMAWHLTRISAPWAWSTTTGSSAITVAIIDTGVYGSHEDLASKMVAGWNVYDNNADTSDVYGHGTTVAGTVAAASNNQLGVTSIAWGCYLMPIRVSAPDGTATYSTIANGIIWAADHGARVANVSYEASDSATVSSAAQYLQSRDGVLTVSAGNYSTFNANPINPYILTVSATDPNDVLYSWSNTGNNIAVAAPGCVYTTLNGGGYGSQCGTSYSAPIVAGVAALVLSVRPGLTPSQVTSMLEQSADKLGPADWDSTYGWGRVNAARAVSLAAGNTVHTTQLPSVSFQLPANGATVSGSITMQVFATDSVGVASVSYFADGVLVGTASVSPYECSLSTATLGNGSHTLTAVGKNTAGNSSTADISVTVSNVPDTESPTIGIQSPESGDTVSGNTTVLFAASDDVGVVKVELYMDGALQSTSTSAPFTMKFSVRHLARGAHTLVARAYDQAGNVGTSAPVTVYTPGTADR